MTNSQNSSEIERLEITQTLVEKVCEEHGPYSARQIAMPSGMAPMTSHCPVCMERNQAERAKRAEESARFQRRVDVQNLFRRSGIPPRFADRTLDGYSDKDPGQSRALRIARRFVEAFAEKGNIGTSLVLAGKPGTGKTHIACGIAHALVEELHSVQFMTVLQAIRHIKETYNKGSEKTETQAIKDLLAPDLLILDEVGAQIGSEHEKMLMFEVINERYQSCRSTILISNLTGDELTEFLGDRVMDRFRENGAVVAFDWASHRGQRALS